MTVLRSIALTLTALPLLPALSAGADERDAHRAHAARQTPAPVVQEVRRATTRFQYVQNAVAEGYLPGPCVSGQNGGAMGIHYVNGALIGDGEVDVTRPEALIYEPLPGGRLRFVGVEFIVLADGWDAAHPGAPPALEGHLFHYVGTPNRYGSPAFYELHVWAWQPNPDGTFADWNSEVSCDAFDGD